MTTLVTGGLGFIGSALTRALVAAGRDVRVFDNGSRGRADRLAGTEVEIQVGDIRDAEAVRRAVSGADTVIHLANVNGTRLFYEQPKLVLDVSVRGMLNVLDACVAEDVGTLVIASSSEVYQTAPAIPTAECVPLLVPDVMNPRYSYGGGKILCELMGVNWGREHFDRMMIFRPHNVYGPDMGRDHVIPQLVEQLRRSATVHLQGDGTETRAFCYIDDLVAGVLLVLERGAHMNVYNIGTGEEVRIGDLARRIALCLGVDPCVEPGAAPTGGTRRRCPDIRKLAALGYAPRVSLDEGLRSTVEWYVRQ